MMKNLLSSLILLSLSASSFAGLPPTSTKGSGDSNPVVSFELDTPNIPITHTGTKASLGTVAVGGGGTGTTSLTSNNVILGNGASAVNFVAPGTSGNVLTSNGTTWTSSAAASGSSGFNQVYNLGFSASISANTLVVSLTQSDGSTAPASGSGAVIVGFRSSTTTSGAFSTVSFTASNSITLGTTDSIGVANATSTALYVYLVSDTTSEICLSATLFDDGSVQSATALTGGADTSYTTLYCTSAHTSKPIRLIGQLNATWSNPNWGSIASVVLSPKVRLNGSVSSNIAGLERIERATLTCGSSASISTQSGTWISSASGTTNVCTVNFVSGMFTATPVCVCTNYNGGNRSCSSDSASTSSVKFYPAVNGSTAENNVPIGIICMGPR